MENQNTGTNKISGILNDNLNIFNDKFRDCPDVVINHVFLKDNTEGCFIYIENLIDLDLVQRDFMSFILNMNYKTISNRHELDSLPSNKIVFYEKIDAVISDILKGCTIFLAEGVAYAISSNLQKFEKRSIEEPVTEKNIRGAHEGFIEILNVNMGILRRKIKNSNLKFKLLKLGEATNETIAIGYIEGIADPVLVNRLYDKISTINYDGILSFGYIEQMITDFPYSIFPQYLTTERPDRVSAALLEGRLVILTEGTPEVSIVPVNFFSFFKAPDDYNTHFIFGSLLGIVRFLSAAIAIYLPSFYIALTTFHYYMIPLNLLIPLAESRAKVPFPPIVEAFIMEFVIEMLREASIRIPTYIGSSIGVVGGIIIGQAAVQAGLVSELLIIIVALTSIATFITPVYDMGLAVRSIRFVMMLLTSIFGVIGMVITTTFILANLITIESLGQPYFQPLIPFKLKDLKDTIIRLPLKFHKTRPNITTRPVDKDRGKT